MGERDGGIMLNGGTSLLSDTTVCIVDDEANIRDSLLDLFESADFTAVAYANGRDFLAQCQNIIPGCIFLDVQLPDMNGLELQHRLESCGSISPIVFMTGYADVPMSVQAMKAGAADFILKPFSPSTVMSAASNALRAGALTRERHLKKNQVTQCLETLTPREREVMAHVANGLLNKQIAWEMQISEIMVKTHRGRLMRKMQSRSLADLIRKIDILDA